MTQKSRRQPPQARKPHEIRFEPSPRRVRVLLGGEVVADSTQMRLLHETGLVPVYYFPWADVREEFLVPSAHKTHCPFKGDASYRSVCAGGKTAKDAMWHYDAPLPHRAELRDYCAFYWDRMDAWYEEDEEVFVHARDPYTRVDVVASSRPVRVLLGGDVIAETARARFLFETYLPTRYYIPKADVQMARLQPSPTRTQCPYKGEAVYWSSGEHKDIAWSYPAPLPECAKIKDHLAFYNKRVDEIIIGDGNAQ